MSLGGQKPRELLAIFLLNPGQTLSADRLVTHLWGDSPSQGAVVTLRTHIGRVRKVIEAARAPAALVNHPGGYRLDLDPQALDAQAFEALVREGQRAVADQRLDHAVAVLEEALALWRGEVLDDLGPPEFATTAATRLNELRLVAWEYKIDSQLAIGDHAHAVSLLQQLVEDHPFRERFTAQLMLALYRAGRQAEALATFASARRRLAEELGLDPGPDLRELESSILRQDPALQQSELPLPAFTVPETAAGSSTDTVGEEWERVETIDAGPIDGGQREPAGAALLERGPVLQRLLDAHAASSESGRLVWLTGEAGVGKTTVLRAFASQVEAPTWRGQCDPLTTPRPLGPLMDLAAGPIAELQRTWADGAEPFTAFGVMLEAIRRQSIPPVIILEDLHWADDGTLDLLRFLTRRLSGTPCLIIASVRDHEFSVRPELVRLLGDSLREDGVERVSLSPLSLDAVKKLSSGTSIDAERLFDVSRGNPFFVTEVIAAGTLLPSNIVGAVHAHAARLGDESRAVLDIVALDPRAVEVEHVRRVADVTEEAIDTAVRGGFLEESDRRLSFRHELARRAIADNLGSVRRRRLHARLLERLAAAGGGEASRLAHHAIGADDPELILRHVPAALDEAVASGARREAVNLTDAVLAFAPLQSPGLEFSLRALQARNLCHLNQPQRALTHASTACRIGRDLRDPRREGLGMTLVARCHWLAGDTVVARQEHEAAIALLRPTGDCPELLEALVSEATNAMLTRQHRECVALAREAVELAHRMDDRAMERLALGVLGTSELVSDDADRGIAMLESLVSDAEAEGDHDMAATLLARLGSGAGEVRRYAQAEKSLNACIDHARAVDSDYVESYCQAWRARIAFEQGRWDDALELAGSPDLYVDGVVSVASVTALTVQARVKARRGDPGAHDLFRELVEASQTLEFQHTWPLRCGIAEELWLRDGDAFAGDQLAACIEQARHADSAWGRGEVGYWAWRTGRESTVLPGSAEPFLAMTDGRWQRAAQLWDDVGCPYERALALAEGDEAARDEALGIFDRLGTERAARWLSRRADTAEVGEE